MKQEGEEKKMKFSVCQGISIKSHTTRFGTNQRYMAPDRM